MPIWHECSATKSNSENPNARNKMMRIDLHLLVIAFCQALLNRTCKFLALFQRVKGCLTCMKLFFETRSNSEQ
jgi:hypothetical protein